MVEIIDFTKLAKKAAREMRAGCQHDYKPRRNGVERCTKCADEFPCRSTCKHVDCWCRRLKLGLVEHYPTEHAVGALVITDGIELVYDTTDEDPVNWILPTGEEGLDVG